MLFLKRVILGSLALGFIFLGGSGTQSGSILAQGGGFIGLILGIIVLYIFFKMAWRAMGCLPSFIMFFIVVVFILYAIGALSNGVSNLGTNLKSFIGHNANIKQDSGFDEISDEYIIEEDDIMPAFDESFAVDDEIVEYDANIQMPQQVQQQPQQQYRHEQSQQQQPQNSVGLGELISNVINGGQQAMQPNQQQQQQNVGFHPENYPVIYGLPRVINGDTIIIQGGYLKLYGVDAAEANQTCADRHGRSYKCGRDAALWLKSWITGNEIECRILKQDRKGNMIGTCSLGEYDIGAALVNSGWAVADTKSTDIYFPYQKQAIANKRGLWQGKFYMPWDWRKLQTKKPKIKIIKAPSDKKGIFDL